MSDIFLSIVVPVYNSENTLEYLCLRVKEVFEKTGNTSTGSATNCELILVDDGSTDGSWQKIVALKLQFPFIYGIKLQRNSGQHKALLCGIQNARGNWIATIDDDLQFAPEDILVLIEKGEKRGADLVYGMPEEKQHSALRNVGSKTLAHILSRYAEMPNRGSSFKVIHQSLAKKITNFNHQFLFVDEVLSWNARHTEYCTVSHVEREDGKSGYSFFALMKMGVKLVLGYTTFPLRLITYFGLLAFFVCLGFIIFFIYQKYTMGAELGFTALIVSIFMSTGLILFCIGVIGEYLNRLFLLQSQKPLYIIKETV
ncbi:MAG TPA: glycosyltransferase family 2 protein [Chitinophagales bacterium]